MSAAIAGGGAWAATAVLGGDGPTGVPGPAAPTAFLAEPLVDGPIPEPLTREIDELAALPSVLPGSEVEKLDAALGLVPQPITIDPAGRLYGVSGRDLVVVARNEAGGWSSEAVAELQLPNVVNVVADGETIVWIEADDGFNDVTRAYRAAAVVHCRDDAGARTLTLPERSSAGTRYDRRSDAFAVGSGVVAVARLNPARNERGVGFAEAADLYVARGCAGRFELVEEGAGAQQIVGDWLYYQHDGAVWRRALDPSQLSPGGAERVATPAEAFLATTDALVWAQPGEPPEYTPTLTVSRTDGRHPHAVPATSGWTIPYTATDAAIAGEVRDQDDQPAGIWIYLPSRAAVVTVAPGASAPPPSITRAAGNMMLAVAWSGAGIEDAWLVKLP